MYAIRSYYALRRQKAEAREQAELQEANAATLRKQQSLREAAQSERQAGVADTRVYNASQREQQQKELRNNFV